MYPPAVYGGGEFLFFQYARELVRQGHEVKVITQRLNGTPPGEVIDGVKVYRVGKPVDYKGHLSMSLFDNLSFIIKSFRAGLRIAKGSDVIHSNTYAPSISAQGVSFFKKIPHVMTVHDVYSQGDFWKDWSSQKGVGKSFNFLGPLLEKMVLKLKPSLIHTVSNTSKRDLIKAKVRAPIRVVPCVINLKDYKKPKVKVKNQFCYVGRHVFYKNVDSVIRAMPAILGKNPKTKFIIMGDGPVRKQWEVLARRLGVINSVRFTGRVSHEHKLRIISESKFIVLPSLVEGFGIVMLESWAMGKPVIASNVPPLNELVNNKNGALVEPYKVMAWADTINKMLKKQPKGLKKYAEQYSVEKVTKRLASLFKTLK